jgi:hypothetical protein
MELLKDQGVEGRPAISIVYGFSPFCPFKAVTRKILRPLLQENPAELLNLLALKSPPRRAK